MSTKSGGQAATVRGPAEHAVRDQIIKAAHDFFAHYGYEKTTMADLAREIGFSKAYIYRFFESKQAIGEAICRDCLSLLYNQVSQSVEQGDCATDKMRRFTRSVVVAGSDLFFSDRKLYEIVSNASSEKWGATQVYSRQLERLIEEIVKEGRESGEFERKTPLDEIRRSIFYALRTFIDPLFLERTLDLLPDAEVEVTGLILRSLAP